MPEQGLRLDPPFEYIVIEYPYEWAQGPDCVHVFNEKSGTGQVYANAWAKALSEGIQKVMEENENA